MADDKAQEAGPPPVQKIERKPVGGGSMTASGPAAAAGLASGNGPDDDDPPPSYDATHSHSATGDQKEGIADDQGGSESSGATPASRRTPPASVQIDKTQPEDFEGEIATTNELPPPEKIKAIDDYIVLDKDGKSHTFKTLYSGANVARRVLVIFVRHFFCGVGFTVSRRAFTPMLTCFS